MKIKEVVSKTGISRDTIRLYERMGLLVDITQPYKKNSYKEYGEKNIDRIDLIKYSQSLGFSLKECKHIIDSLESGQLDKKEKNKLIANKLEEIDKRIGELKKFRVLLEQALKKTCEG